MKMSIALFGLGFLAGCGGEGTWKVTTWGEDYIETAIPASVFADGCSVQYDEFVVVFEHRQLVDGDGEVVGEIEPAQAYDLTVAGPSDMGETTVPADHYSHVEVVVAPVAEAELGTATADQLAALTDANASVLVDGTLTCGGTGKHFRWTFDESTTYECEPPDLTIASGGSDETQLTIHGDHLFYDGLENADAVVRGEALFNADTNDDGEITLAELGAVSIPALGYEVGEYSDVLTLQQFVSHLSRTIVHIDGEGECRVDF